MTLNILAALIVILSGSLTNAATSLPENIYEMNSIDPSVADDSDLKVIDGIIENSSIVGLGESVHTTGGQYEAKFRIIKYLILKKNFRAFTMETPRLQGLVATIYLSNCTQENPPASPSVNDAVESIFPVFGSTTTTNLFSWICEFNKTHKNDPVIFYGFDMQDSSLQIREINSFLLEYAPNEAEAFNKKLNSCFSYPDNSEPPKISDLERTTCLNAVKSIRKFIKDHHTQFSPAVIAWMDITLSDLSASENVFYYHGRDQKRSSTFRDVEMANSLTQLKLNFFPNSKTIVWAHNQHLELDGEIDFGNNQYKNMGKVLASIWGKNYFPIGFVSYKTEINWPISEETMPRCYKFPPIDDPTSVEKILHDLNRPYLIVDLKKMSETEGSLFSSNNSYLYDQGENYSQITKQFGGLVFLENSKPIISTYWGSCD